MEYKKLCQEVIALAKVTGEYILEQRKTFDEKSIREKGSYDFVTLVDLGSEERLTSGLKKLIPGCSFLAEEQEYATGNEYRWIIDPLDGTTNYIHGVPPYSISIALEHNENLVLGVVLELVSGECFYTWENAPSYLNGKTIRVSDAGNLNSCLVGTGFPYRDLSKMEPFLRSLEYCLRHSHGVRRHGSAAVDLAWLACGRFDAFWEYGLHAWDVAAGALLIQNAGGRVSDFDGGGRYLRDNEIIAANNLVFNEFYHIISGFFNAGS